VGGEQIAALEGAVMKRPRSATPQQDVVTEPDGPDESGGYNKELNRSRGQPQERQRE